MLGQFLKKSLRAKFTVILFSVGIVPLVTASVFFYYTSKDAFFKNVFKELKWNVDEISTVIEGYFLDAAKDLLTASQNTAFRMYFIDPANKKYWLSEQHKTLRYLRSIYPDMLDEACFIENTGQEVSRIVFDELAPDDDLSSEEDRQVFFKEAFRLEEGEVYQGRPIISEDTNRWVLPNATPIVVEGRKAAILHFEITMTYFQRLLKKLINPDRGYGFILSERGEFMAHTTMEISETLPFPKGLEDSTPKALADIYKRMMAGERGVEHFTSGGEEHFVIFRPIKTTIGGGKNPNAWSIAYVLPASRVYVELDILRYNIIAVVSTAFFTFLLAYGVGSYITRPIRELARATVKVAEGELPRVELTSEDELGELTESFNQMAETIKRRDEQLKSLAITDGLTGIYNYRYFRTQVDKHFKAARRFTRPMSLIIGDVDHFKLYNDSQGHIRGDAVLRKVAETFLKSVREVDVVARYGGEEFAIILPETSLDEALKVAERVRARVVEEDFPFEGQQPEGDLTVSLGVAELTTEMADPDALVEEADRRLYQAKASGRNRVCPGPGCDEAGGEDDKGGGKS